MPTPAQLTATATLVGQHGLAANTTITSQITTFHNKAHLVRLANIFTVANTAFSITDANIAANVSANVANILANLGVGVTNGSQWLIDFYPSNITPTTSGTVYNYFTGNGKTIHTAGFANTLQSQASKPFSYNVQGFANVFSTVQSYAQSVFDTVASVNMLQSKTYAQMGIGYTGPADVVTMGLGNSAPVIANVVSSWGTMYDVKNLGKLGDPYVFGQNLLNQRLGRFGGLTEQLTAAGLNVTNLVQIPLKSKVTTNVIGTTVSATSVGPVTLPTVTPVTTTTVVTGNSDKVVTGIYNSVTGANLLAIVTSTGATVSNVSIATLADYLDFNKVVDSTSRTQLSTVGVTDFASFGSYLQSHLGQGRFKSWSELASTVGNITLPTLASATTDPSASVLSPSTISTLNNLTGTGSGSMNNPIPVDYLGACAGMPYTTFFTTLNNNYYTVANSVGLLANLTSLNLALSNYIASQDTIAPTAIQTAVTNVNSTLSSLSSSNATVVSSRTAYYQLLNTLATEISNLNKAGVVFDAGDAQTLTTFAQGFGSTASDSTQYNTAQFLGNLITDDSYGDTLKAVVAESINTALLAAKGIQSTSDPKPGQAIAAAAAQGLSVKDYISQNK